MASIQAFETSSRNAVDKVLEFWEKNYFNLVPLDSDGFPMPEAMSYKIANGDDIWKYYTKTVKVEGGENRTAHFYTVWNELSKNHPVPKASAGVHFTVKENGELSFRFESHRLTHTLALPPVTSPEFEAELEKNLPALPKKTESNVITPPPQTPGTVLKNMLTEQLKGEYLPATPVSNAVFEGESTTTQQPMDSSLADSAPAPLSASKPTTPPQASTLASKAASQTLSMSQSQSKKNTPAIETEEQQNVEQSESDDELIEEEEIVYPVSDIGIPSRRVADVIDSKVRVAAAIDQKLLLADKKLQDIKLGAKPFSPDVTLYTRKLASRDAHSQQEAPVTFDDLESIIIPPESLTSRELMSRAHLEAFPNIYSEDQVLPEGYELTPVGKAFQHGKQTIRKLFQDTDIFFYIQEDRPTAELIHKFRLLTPTVPVTEAAKQASLPQTAQKPSRQTTAGESIVLSEGEAPLDQEAPIPPATDSLPEKPVTTEAPESAPQPDESTADETASTQPTEAASHEDEEEEALSDPGEVPKVEADQETSPPQDQLVPQVSEAQTTLQQQVDTAVPETKTDPSVEQSSEQAENPTA